MRKTPLELTEYIAKMIHVERRGFESIVGNLDEEIYGRHNTIENKRSVVA